MARLDWRARLALWPSQTPGLIEAVGLTRAEVDAAAWAVRPDGSRHQGPAALAAAVDQLWPAGVPVCGTLVRVPIVRRPADRVYAWVAAHRQRLPGAAACQVGQALSPAPEAVLAEARCRAADR